jgi:hypothetical protein
MGAISSSRVRFEVLASGINSPSIPGGTAFEGRLFEGIAGDFGLVEVLPFKGRLGDEAVMVGVMAGDFGTRAGGSD